MRKASERLVKNGLSSKSLMACCRAQQFNPVVGPESSRIALVLENARQCAILRALGKGTIREVCLRRAAPGADVPRASVVTAARTACLNYTSAPVGPESSRIRALQETTIAAAKNVLDPTTRFAHYSRGPPLPICSVIPQEALNANVPHMQGLRCPLPNRSDLIILPG